MAEIKMQYPEAVDMEKYLLGCMLVGDSRDNCAKIFASVEANDFFKTENQILFNILKNISERGDFPNTLTAFEELKKLNLIDKVEFNYLTALPAMVSTDAYIDSYIAVIKEKANLRRLMLIATELFQDASAGVKSLDAIQSSVIDAISRVGSQNKSNIFDSRNCLTAQMIDRLDVFQKYKDRRTGFYNLDAHHKTFEPGVYVIGAVPAAGKTTFCWQFAEQLALQGETVLYFTYEIEWDKLWTKSIARRFFKFNNYSPSVNQILNADINSALIKASFEKGINFEEELDASGGALIIIESDEDYSAERIINTSRSYCKKDQKAPIVFVDYLQKVAHDKEFNRDGVDKIMRAFKYFQRQSDTTFVVITSYNRMNYRQQVALESSKESGGIDYEADVVWGMQLNVMNSIKGGEPESNIRKKVDEAMKQQPREIHLKCVKNRNGESYDAYFNYYSASAHFEPVDSFDDAPPFDLPTKDSNTTTDESEKTD